MNRIVKTLLPLIVLTLVATWLMAQTPSLPGANRGVPQANPQGDAQAEPSEDPAEAERRGYQLLRVLRQAMTNAPAQPLAGQQGPAAPGRPGLAVPQAQQPGQQPGVPAGQQQPAQPQQPGPGLPGAPAQPLPQPGQTAGQGPGQTEGIPVAPVPDGEMVISAQTLQVSNMPLEQFLEVYSMISGKTVLRPLAIQGAAQGFTLKAQTDMTRSEAVFAIESVLALNGIAILPVDDKFVRAVAKTDAPAEGGEIADVRTLPSTQTEPFVTQIVELKSLKPSELQTLLASFTKVQNGVVAFDNTQTIVLRDTASNVKRMMEVIEKVDVVRESDYSLEAIPVRYGKVVDLYNTMSALISGSAPTTGAASGAASQVGSGAGTSTATTLRQRVGGGGYGQYGGGGYGGYGGYGGSRYGGGGYYPYQASQPTSVGSSQSTFQGRLQQIIRRASEEDEVQVLGDARIVPDERSNKLLIFANRKDMSMITNIVSKVDVLLAQVLIEAVILEVKLGDSMNVGVSIAQNPKQFTGDLRGGGGSINPPANLLGSITNFPGALPAGFSYFGQIGNELDVAVAAIARDNEVSIVSRPRIQTSHALPGLFVIGETVPYIEGFSDYGGIVSGVGTRSYVREKRIATELEVTPIVTPEGYVIMEVIQTFDQRGGEVLIEGNPYPIVNTRAATATLTIQSGDTIILGGFITQSKSNSRSGVPILKDIPLLGALFRSKNVTNDRTELIVLMRATVLESPSAAAMMAIQERSELPGVQQAERQFQRDDEKRRERLRNR